MGFEEAGFLNGGRRFWAEGWLRPFESSGQTRWGLRDTSCELRECFGLAFGFGFGYLFGHRGHRDHRVKFQFGFDGLKSFG